MLAGILQGGRIKYLYGLRVHDKSCLNPRFTHIGHPRQDSIHQLLIRLTVYYTTGHVPEDYCDAIHDTTT